MTDVKIIGSALQTDPPGSVMVICACRTVPMQREETAYRARCRACGRVSTILPAGAPRLAADADEHIQERSY